MAKGRKMTVAQVDSIAQGRIWTGEEALKIGLIDKIGGMDDAIKAAAKLAKIKEYRTQDFPEYDKKFADLLAGFPFAKSKDAMIREEIGPENYEVLERLRNVSKRRGVQALLPIRIDMH